ncbi:excalibur calcium-binding domain-containing protein [Rhodococcus sp. H36-A4]|uniref:excalibur calcium-binding domain-containing protein n=1 Tax=Rhodococcus sp. H36-A4 TaxID=3004353 RepID=UPI0022AF6F51|nr:excalibur calcium-binding domain-containing protein [Rhodococcus sp. H36-A4]MCZ4080067.1 excalibur calcium-binding domain-containing protein [Rhodococcus sp. H36-A4]
MTEPYVFPGAARPERPRPLLGKIIAWISVAIGALVLLASLSDFSFAGLVAGVCIIAAGTLYAFGKPSRGRVLWATPAIAALPALVAFSIMTPPPASDEMGSSRAFSAPSVSQVTTSTSSPKTTSTPRSTTTSPPTTTAPSTVVPPPEPETIDARPPVPTTTQYVPAPAPVYVAEPEPVFVPPAPLVAVPDVPSAVSYANCTAVRAAGAAPIYAGEPGYSSKLDRDGDGVACEN